MTSISRRALLAAAPALSVSALALRARQSRAAQESNTVETEPFARVLELTQGVWVVESTPMSGNMNTVCNGGIVAGRDGVLVLEGFNTPGGAAWAASLAERLTGRPPSHVVLTHYHADHSGGLAGYQRGAEGPALLATSATRDLIAERYGPTPAATGTERATTAPRVLLPDTLISDEENTTIDLGGRTVTLIPRAERNTRDGSDLTLGPFKNW